MFFLPPECTRSGAYCLAHACVKNIFFYIESIIFFFEIDRGHFWRKSNNSERILKDYERFCWSDEANSGKYSLKSQNLSFHSIFFRSCYFYFNYAIYLSQRKLNSTTKILKNPPILSALFYENLMLGNQNIFSKLQQEVIKKVLTKYNKLLIHGWYTRYSTPLIHS